MRPGRSPVGHRHRRHQVHRDLGQGKAAVIWSETTVTDPDGKPLWKQKRSIFARGEGGFGGDRGPSATVVIPDRAPDVEIDVPTLPQQALLYRLCGDRNRCIRIPNSLLPQAFPANPARPVHLQDDVQGARRHSARRRRRPRWARTGRAWPASCSPAKRCVFRPGKERPVRRQRHRSARDGAVALGDVEFASV